MVTPAERKIKGVIFDLDQTLIDSLQAFTEAFNRGIKHLGLEAVGEEMVASFLDNGWRMDKMLSETFPSVFLEEETRKQCQDEMLNIHLLVMAAARHVTGFFKRHAGFGCIAFKIHLIVLQL